MKELSISHLLSIKDLTKSDIDLIFKTADSFKEVINRPIKKVPTLRDITIANLFFENSTRTKLSFELAEKRLSADIVNFTAGNSSLKKGETLVDKANNIYSELNKNNIDAIIDDTDENFSSKIKKMNLIGAPYQIIIGKKKEGDLFEFKELGAETQNLSLDKIIKIITKQKAHN